MNLEGKRSQSHSIDRKRRSRRRKGGRSAADVPPLPSNCIIRLKCLSDGGEAATETLVTMETTAEETRKRLS